MIKPEQIPDEVVEALLDTSNVAQPWKHAIAAAINAWPEVKRVKGYFTHDTDYYEPAIILPLPQEKPDEITST
jgi:hypothetical protein